MFSTLLGKKTEKSFSPIGCAKYENNNSKEASMHERWLSKIVEKTDKEINSWLIRMPLAGVP